MIDPRSGLQDPEESQDTFCDDVPELEDEDTIGTTELQLLLDRVQAARFSGA